MKLLYFALCVLLFVPGLVIAADDDGDGPSNRPAHPVSKMTRKEVTLERIAQMQASIKARKEKMAELLAISSNPNSGKGAIENADAEWSNLHTYQQLEQQILDNTIGQY